MAKLAGTLRVAVGMGITEFEVVFAGGVSGIGIPEECLDPMTYAGSE